MAAVVVVIIEKLAPRPLAIGHGPPLTVKNHVLPEVPKDTDADITPMPTLAVAVVKGPLICWSLPLLLIKTPGP
jgi:hypothetical protein